VVRVVGEKPKGEGANAPEEGANAPEEGAKAPFQDVVVTLEGADAANFRIETTFKPVKIVVDPEVRLLFAGRQRCEKSL
jgi:hypothetical protein